MGKEKPGFLTPKAIANRIKSKGLQKLRWYCQMCQKQCRDENGFKCHAMSESHQRQLLLFAEHSKKFMDEFSSDFHRGYMNVLKRQFGTKRVHANLVYKEYINDRDHIHMNSTQWMTLTDYVKWLGRKGICVVDETEKGWFVTYIDRDPETLMRQAEAEKKRKLDLDDTQRQQMFLDKQMERVKGAEAKPTEQPTELKKNENDVIKISFKKTVNRLASASASASASKEKPTTSKSEPLDYNLHNDEEDEDAFEEGDEIDENDEDDQEMGSSEQFDNSNNSQDSLSERKRSDLGLHEATAATAMTIKQEKLDVKEEKEVDKEVDASASQLRVEKIEPVVKQEPAAEASKPVSAASALVKAAFKLPSSSSSDKSKPEKRKQSALDEIMQEEERRKETKNRKDYWLHKDIVVKITTNKLGEKYYKKKGVITDVIDKYTGVVKLQETGALIKLDQAHLETVLPAVGKQVLVVNGAYRGEIAVLEDINQDEFCATISIAAGPLKGRVVNKVQYEDISKLNQ